MKYEIEDENVLAIDEHGHTTLTTTIDAIASWAELLGCSTAAEAVQCMMQAKDPGILDKETSRNAWTSAYEQVERDELADRQQTRMAALHPVLTASGALSPDGREETRRLLGLDAMPVMEDADGRLAATLAGVADRIAVKRDRFRRQSIDYLTDHRH